MILPRLMPQPPPPAEPHDANAANEAPPPGPMRLSPLWLLFAALALALPLSALLARRALEPRLPMLLDLPAFTLIDQDAKPFGRQQLLGRVVIADFIFTHCPVACPRLTSLMKQLQDRMSPQESAGALRLLSVSVDPERDTPEKLRAYMKTHGADPRSWTFLTGEETEVERAVVKGFRMAMAKAPLGDGGPGAATLDGGDSAEEIHAQAFEILHGEKFVLVDARGRIRGYYDVGEAAGLERLLSDARRLVGGEP